jgi:hypothetical protein
MFVLPAGSVDSAGFIARALPIEAAEAEVALVVAVADVITT